MTTSRKIVVRILLLIAELIEQDREARNELVHLRNHISYETARQGAEAPHA